MDKLIAKMPKFIFYSIFFTIYIYIYSISLSYYNKSLNEYDIFSIIFPMVIAIFQLIFMITFIYKRTYKKITDNKKWIVIPCEIFSISLLLRLFFIMLAGNKLGQVSDFAIAYNSSLVPFGTTITKSRIYPSWGMYSLYLKLINKILGESQLSGVVFGAILTSFSAIFIYYIILITTKKIKLSLMASILFGTYPILIYYTLVLTPDFIFIFFVLLSILCLCISKKIFYKSKKLYMSFCALGGVFLAISGFFKSIDKIIIIALIIMILLEVLAKVLDEGYSKKIYIIIKENMLTKAFKKKMLGVFSFTMCYLICVQSMFALLDYANNCKVNRSPIAHFLYIGLASDSFGRYTKEKSIYNELLEEYEYDYDKVDKIMYDKLKQDINENHHLTLNNFNKKIVRAYSSDEGMSSFSNSTISEHGVNALARNDNLVILSKYFQIMYCIQSFFIVLGALFSLSNFFKDREYKIIMFVELIMVGFFFLMMLSETQSRYKCVILPFMSIVAAYGIDEFIIKFRSLTKKSNSEYDKI